MAHRRPFLAGRQEQIALGIQDQALAEISRHMIDFIGMHTWEELCREWTLRAGAKGVLPFLPDQVGSAWNTNTQIDVAGINRMGKTLILGECKWGQTASERPVLSSSIDRAARLVPAQGKWKIYFNIQITLPPPAHPPSAAGSAILGSGISRPSSMAIASHSR